MKYLKIHVRSDSKGNMIYPINYQEEIGNHATNHLYHEDGPDLKLLLCITDEKFNSPMIRTDCELITETEAIAISEANEERTEIVKDEVKLRRLELCAKLGTPLTKEDEDCLRHGTSNSIFAKKEIVADKISKLKARGL